ncbi:MAG TPA: response regulator [Opitutaceae bacterium]|nr:response regulator [Opitutaceae bacterium]
MPASSPAPRILVVDDDEGLLILMADALRAEGYEVFTAGSGQAALKWCEGHRPDLMLLDLKLRDVNALVMLEKLRAGKALVPFIIVTGQGDEKVAVEVMKQGALDYVMKNTALLDLLPGVVKRTLTGIVQRKILGEAEVERQRLEAEVIATSERERTSIGADLHDGLGQQLTAIELMCTALKDEAAREAPRLARRLEQVSAQLREAIAQTRALARGLVPMGDGADALQTGLAELVERVGHLGRVQCRFECREAVLLPDPVVAGHLYRIAQEAVNNALKHAGAGRLTIRLAKKDGVLRLEIADDGAGLSKSGSNRAGVGLGVMQHRARVIGAKLTVHSKRGEGVTVLCELPLKS